MTIDRKAKLRDLEFRNDKGESVLDLKEEYMKLNYLDIDEDTIVYRVFSLERFLQLLHTNKLVLVKPKLWEDPYENFFLNSKGVLPDGIEVTFEPMREQYYGQCWTLESECDGLWKTYSPNHTGIKVKSTVSKLMNALYDVNNPYHQLSYFIGKVHYVSNERISDLFNNITPLLSSGNELSIPNTLLTKREAFKYENEVRLLFKAPIEDEIDSSMVRNKWNIKKDIFSINVDPNEILEEVTFHPRMSRDLFCSLKEVINTLGFNGKVSKSSLYDKPNFRGEFLKNEK
ncbi:DUF2971 domain-containing protein [Halobacillus sp. GSS1]|uniref:DUF2971 domain-containing protein n=1 Tax=Halobacillus sp. GSS1 TaxID=2815919 RepID=UPI001A8BFF1B|nr:DUF2971 domain-containing protein [Halobacillus sp. GSS1]MBN9654709.1 DUF2971 domain-containing protein [Halobacillus sp. GSS1]